MDTRSKFRWRILLLSAVTGVILGCSMEQLLPPVPTGIPIPTVTITPTPSPTVTLTLTPTEIAPAQAGTPLPPAGVPITLENAGQMKVFARQGHGIAVRMSLSYDGNLLAAASTGGVYLFDAATLSEIRHIETTSPQMMAAFSPDSTLVATAGQNGMVSLWQVQDGRLLRQFDSGAFSSITAMIFSPDGTRLVTSDSDQVTHIWQVKDGIDQGTILDNARIIRLLSFSESADQLFSWAPVEPIKIWNLNTRQKVRDIAISVDDLGKNAINGAFSANGAVFAANSGMRIRVYNTKTGFISQLVRLKEPALFVLLSGDGSQLLVVGESQMGFYEMVSKTDPLLLPIPSSFPGPDRVLFGPDGKSLLLLNPELSSWKLEKNSEPAAGPAAFAPDFDIADAFPDSPQQSLSLMMDGSLQILDQTGVLQQSIQLDGGALSAAAITTDGSQLATSGKQKGVAIWTRDGKFIKTLSQLTANALAFSGTNLLAGAMPDGNLLLWQLPAGTVKQQLRLDTPPQQVALSADGKMLAVRSLGGVSLWDLSGSTPRQEGKYDGYGMALSPDGSLLAVSQFTGNDRSISIYRSGKSDPVSSLDAGSQWMAFSADGQLLAVAGDPLTLWHVDDGTLVQQFPTKGVLGRPYFIDQGRLLALVSWDGSRHLWGVP